MDKNAEHWKLKYEESEQRFQTLKELAHKGVADYEELKKKYDQNYKQYGELKAELEEAREKLRSFDYYATEAVQQFDELEKKCELQENLVQEVSTYASKVTQERKKLQRQSQALLDMFGSQLTVASMKEITEDEDVNGDVNDNKGLSVDQKQLLERIEELNGTVASLESRLKHSNSERAEALESIQIIATKLQIEKQKVHRLELCVKEHSKSLQKFQRVSMIAIQEHEELETKFLIEKELKEAVFKEAQRIESERKAVIRQSSAAILDASADVKLRTAFESIEELSRKLNETECKLLEKEEEIKDLTNNSEQIHSINSFEMKLSEATDEIKRLEAQVNDSTTWNEKLTRDYEALEQKLQVTEARFAPPPPPPPPPPPAILRPLFKLVGKKPKRHLPHEAKDKPPEFQKALDELMAKIRGGNLSGTLRGANSRSNSMDTPAAGQSAMHDMQSMLKRMSLRRSPSETNPPSSPEHTNPFGGELLQAFKRVRGAGAADIKPKIEESEEQVFDV